MFRIRTFFFIAAALIAGTASAAAAPVLIRDNAADNGGSVFAAGLSRGVGITYEGVNRNVGAGAFSLQFENGDGEFIDFLTFCLQLSETLSLPREHHRTSGEAYFGNTADRDAIGALYNYFRTPTLGFANATSAAAMQIIIWEVIEDGAINFDLSDGVFRTRTAAVRNQAEAFWDQLILGLDADAYENIAFDVFAAEGTQDLIVETPLPGALALLLSGIAGLGFASRQKKLS